MSSLLSKLKTLVQASARGSRRRKKAPGRAQEAASVPEVTEAAARQSTRAEVTEAPPAQAAASKPARDLAEPGPGEAHSGALEEERVVDIIRGKQT